MMARMALAFWHDLSAKQADGGAMGQATLVGSYRGGPNWRHTSPVPNGVPAPLCPAFRGMILPNPGLVGSYQLVSGPSCRGGLAKKAIRPEW
jgi:hypothetical protein